MDERASSRETRSRDNLVYLVKQLGQAKCSEDAGASPSVFIQRNDENSSVSMIKQTQFASLSPSMGLQSSPSFARIAATQYSLPIASSQRGEEAYLPALEISPASTEGIGSPILNKSLEICDSPTIRERNTLFQLRNEKTDRPSLVLETQFPLFGQAMLMRDSTNSQPESPQKGNSALNSTIVEFDLVECQLRDVCMTPPENQQESATMVLPPGKHVTFNNVQDHAAPEPPAPTETQQKTVLIDASTSFRSKREAFISPRVEKQRRLSSQTAANSIATPKQAKRRSTTQSQNVCTANLALKWVFHPKHHKFVPCKVLSLKSRSRQTYEVSVFIDKTKAQFPSSQIRDHSLPCQVSVLANGKWTEVSVVDFDGKTITASDGREHRLSRIGVSSFENDSESTDARPCDLTDARSCGLNNPRSCELTDARSCILAEINTADDGQSSAVNSERSVESICAPTPLKTQRSKDGLFHGYCFIVTNMRTSARRKSGTEFCDLAKTQLKYLIESEEGALVEDYLEAFSRYREKEFQLVLVSRSPCTTIKYIGALACGIPCLSCRFVIDAVERLSIPDFNAYRLSNGFSSVLDAYVGGLYCKNLFSGLGFTISGSTEFCNSWSVVLQCMDALVGPQELPDRRHLCLAESPLPSRQVAILRRANVSIVFAEWIVQCVVNMRLVDLDSSLCQL